MLHETKAAPLVKDFNSRGYKVQYDVPWTIRDGPFLHTLPGVRITAETVNVNFYKAFVLFIARYNRNLQIRVDG